MSSAGGITPGDPLGGGPDEERRHESGLPLPPPSSSSSPLGYTSAPPPGAGGVPPAAPWAAPAPAGLGGGLVLASWGRRVVAALIDLVIVLVIAAILFAILGTVFAGFGLFDDSSGTADDGTIVGFVLSLFATVAVVVVAGFLYAPLMMARTDGQTVGRKAAGIRVVRTDRQPMTFGWAFLREVVVKGVLINLIAGSATFGLATLLDLLWPLWDEENRALHDFVVQTRTVMA
ncbi:MAG TPA: RDD family protein [Solirubrobacteraceae bacterium]|jgi:uncharacterized RDD family membrane protein YckC